MSIWVQITAGQGKVECRHAVTRLAAIMQQEAQQHGEVMLPLERKPGPRGEHDTDYSVVFAIESDTVPVWLKSWLGTVEWDCRSPFRSENKRRNWYVGVGVLKQPDLKKHDLTKVKVEFTTSTGPGGQNVNKVASAVRLVHLPTGIMITVQDQRSQHQNRSLAFERLKRRLQAEDERVQGDARQRLWEQHWDIERGNPARVYEGLNFRRKR